MCLTRGVHHLLILSIVYIPGWKKMGFGKRLAKIQLSRVGFEQSVPREGQVFLFIVCLSMV